MNDEQEGFGVILWGFICFVVALVVIVGFGLWAVLK